MTGQIQTLFFGGRDSGGANGITAPVSGTYSLSYAYNGGTPYFYFFIDLQTSTSGTYNITVDFDGGLYQFTYTGISAFNITDLQTYFNDPGTFGGLAGVVTSLGGTVYQVRIKNPIVGGGYASHYMSGINSYDTSGTDGNDVGVFAGLETLTYNWNDTGFDFSGWDTIGTGLAGFGNYNCIAGNTSGELHCLHFYFGNDFDELTYIPALTFANIDLQRAANTITVATTTHGAANDTGTLGFSQTRPYVLGGVFWTVVDNGGGNYTASCDPAGGVTVTNMYLQSQGSCDGSGIVVTYTSSTNINIDMGGATSGSYQLGWNSGNNFTVSGVNASDLLAAGKASVSADITEVLQQCTLSGVSSIAAPGWNLAFSNTGAGSPANSDFAQTASASDLQTWWNSVIGGATVTGDHTTSFVFTLASGDAISSTVISSFIGTIYGSAQVVSVTLPDSPTAGTLHVTLDSVASSDFNYNDSSPAAISGWTGGGSAGAWTYTNNTFATDKTATGTEGSSILTKDLTGSVLNITTYPYPGDMGFQMDLESPYDLGSFSETGIMGFAIGLNSPVTQTWNVNGSMGFAMGMDSPAALAYYVTGSIGFAMGLDSPITTSISLTGSIGFAMGLSSPIGQFVIGNTMGFAMGLASQVTTGAHITGDLGFAMGLGSPLTKKRNITIAGSKFTNDEIGFPFFVTLPGAGTDIYFTDHAGKALPFGIRQSDQFVVRSNVKANTDTIIKMWSKV